MPATTQTRNIIGTSRNTSSDMVIGVQPTLIMEYTLSMKVREYLLVVGWITHLHENYSYPSRRVLGTDSLLHQADSQCGSKRLAGVRVAADLMSLTVLGAPRRPARGEGTQL